jgi:hypothetical protein
MKRRGVKEELSDGSRKSSNGKLDFICEIPETRRLHFILGFLSEPLRSISSPAPPSKHWEAADTNHIFFPL